MSEKIQFASKTDRGKKRSINEDSILTDPELGLWLIADGMGGYQKGEVASQIAVETVQQSVRRQTPLATALFDAHEAINHAAEQGHGAAGMGTTVVALKTEGAHYQIAWAGDSRAYLWNTSGGLRQLSQDHSYLAALIRSGAVSPEEAKDHKAGHILTSCLGCIGEEAPHVDELSGVFAKGDAVLLCSDGVTGELSDEEIAELLKQHTAAQAGVDHIVDAALRKGGRDNISAVLVPAPGYSSGAFLQSRPWLRNGLLFGAGIVLALALLVVLANVAQP